jgi:DNA-binding XRE family transcriptional regulator
MEYYISDIEIDSEKTMATTAEKLRQRRLELKKTQAEVAAAADMSTVQL